MVNSLNTSFSWDAQLDIAKTIQTTIDHERQTIMGDGRPASLPIDDPLMQRLVRYVNDYLASINYPKDKHGARFIACTFTWKPTIYIKLSHLTPIYEENTDKTFNMFPRVIAYQAHLPKQTWEASITPSLSTTIELEPFSLEFSQAQMFCPQGNATVTPDMRSDRVYLETPIGFKDPESLGELRCTEFKHNGITVSTDQAFNITSFNDEPIIAIHQLPPQTYQVSPEGHIQIGDNIVSINGSGGVLYRGNSVLMGSQLTQPSMLIYAD